MMYKVAEIKKLNYAEHKKSINYVKSKVYEKLYSGGLNLPFSVAVGGGISCIVHEATWDKDIQVSFFVNQKVVSDRKFMYDDIELKKFILSINKNEFHYMTDLF